MVETSRDLETIICFFAILYSGNFYVPIDCEMPYDRILSIKNTLNSKLGIYHHKNIFTDSALSFDFEKNYGILFRNRSIGLFTYRTEYAQGTDKDKLPGNHVQLPQRVYKTFGLPVVHTFEVVLIYTFCSSGTVDNVIELTIQFLMTGKLRTKLTGMRKVELKKMYLLVLQILPAAGRTDACPYAESPPQRLFHDETPDKPACSCY